MAAVLVQKNQGRPAARRTGGGFSLSHRDRKKRQARKKKKRKSSKAEQRYRAEAEAETFAAVVKKAKVVEAAAAIRIQSAWRGVLGRVTDIHAEKETQKMKAQSVAQFDTTTPKVAQAKQTPTKRPEKVMYFHPGKPATVDVQSCYIRC